MPSTKRRTTGASKQSLPLDAAPFKPEDYAAVTRAAELVLIELTSCNFSVAPEFFRELAQDNPRHKYSYGEEFENPVYDSESGIAGGEFVWTLGVKVGRKKVVRVSATYRIIYTNLSEMNGGAITAFVKRVGRFATYPYFRGLVSHLSWESNAELPIMPVISISP